MKVYLVSSALTHFFLMYSGGNRSEILVENELISFTEVKGTVHVSQIV